MFPYLHSKIIFRIEKFTKLFASADQNQSFGVCYFIGNLEQRKTSLRFDVTSASKLTRFSFPQFFNTSASPDITKSLRPLRVTRMLFKMTDVLS